MKKHILLVFALLVTCTSGLKAQVSINVNIGTQPVWGPVGYDYVDYYYMPDIETYYSVPTHQYTYFDGGRWITVRSLPPRYANFDLYHAHKVVINERSPWMHHDRYRTEYVRYKGKHDQVIIRDSHDERYFANPRHPEHSKWKGNNGNGNGNGRGNGPRANPGRGNEGRGPGNQPQGNPGRGPGNQGGGPGNQPHGNPGHGGGDNGGGNGHGGGGGNGHGNGGGNGHGKGK